MRDEDAVKVHVVNAEDMKQAVATEEVEPEHIIAVSFTLPAVGVSGENQEQESPMQILQLDPLRKVAYISFNGSGQIFLAHSEAQANALQSGTQQNADSGAMYTCPTTVKVEGTGPLWAVQSNGSLGSTPNGGESYYAAGSSTPAAADTLITGAQLVNLPAGTYTLEATVYVDGTVVTADDEDNMQIYLSGQALLFAGPLLYPVESGSTPIVVQYTFTLVNPETQNVSIRSGTVTPSGTAKYHGALTATPVTASSTSSVVGVLSARRGA